MGNSLFSLSIAIAVGLGAWGTKIAEKKNRSRNLGFTLGFFFGLIGILILIFLIDKKSE